MPLLSPDTSLSVAQLRTIYAEHREGIVEMLQRIENPTGPITVATRRLLAEDLARSYLAAGPDDGAALPKEQLILWVNLSYDVLMSTLDLYKRSVQIPFVPPPRT